jgi:hypothetical protein
MPLSTELQTKTLPSEQVSWFKVLSTVESTAEDIRTLLIWHPFHHARCTLTLFPGIDALQHAALTRDARTLRTIGHSALVPVLDVVESSGRTGLLVEGFGGYSLRDCLDEVGALEVDEAVAIFRQLLSGVASLHHHGLTHCDLRPEHIQLDVSGDKLIAQIRGLGRGAIERFDLHSLYLAPELASGGNPDPRADVFSLGCIFYECLSGKPPFVEIDPWSRRQEIRENAPESLQNMVSMLPLEVAFAISSALKFHAGERFANARAFARALPRDAWLQTEEIVIPREPSEEIITGKNNDEWAFSIAPDPEQIAEEDAAPAKQYRPPPAIPDARPTPTGGPASTSERQAARPVPAGKPPFLGGEPGLGERMAAAPVDAVIMGSRLLRVLAAPALATLFLVVLWNWSAARETRALQNAVQESRGELEPIFARSMALSEDVIAVGVEPNKIRPLIARFESADTHAEQVQSGHTLVTAMFRLVRSLRPSGEVELDQRRRRLEVQLNALERDYTEYKAQNASLREVTGGSLVGRLMELIR